jgi:uncharacterized protein YdbL (DUF1318 family)
VDNTTGVKEEAAMEKTWETFWTSGKVTDYLGYRNAVETDDQTRQRVRDNNGTVSDGDGHGFDSHAYQ